MSRVIVEGHPPSGEGLLARLDVEAAAAARLAAVEAEVVVRSEVPHGRTGKLAAATKTRASRVPTGYAVTVGVSRGAPHDPYATAAQVSRWVQRGTGLYGPGHRRIRSKRLFGRMTLPGGRVVRSVKGQPPNPYMGRITATAGPLVLRAFEAGAHRLGGTLR